jgi:hypothetical protein
MEKKFIYYKSDISPTEILNTIYCDTIEEATEIFAFKKQLDIEVFLSLFTIEEWI